MGSEQFEHGAEEGNWDFGLNFEFCISRNASLTLCYIYTRPYKESRNSRKPEAACSSIRVCDRGHHLQRTSSPRQWRNPLDLSKYQAFLGPEVTQGLLFEVFL
jgi:hypothetical protein